MFVMTANIFIADFKAIKPNALKWERSIFNHTDTATIKMPAISKLKKEGDTYTNVQTGLQFEEGMPVEVYGGYNGLNYLRFKGFVSRVNYTIPLEVECEGYAYQLRKKIGFTKSYYNTKVKTILEDLIVGTQIKLSDAIPEIPLEKCGFNNQTGLQVLEWFKKECLLTVYFNFDTLYVGALELEPKTEVKLRLGYNVIKDNELKFNNKKEFADVRIVLEKKGKKGTKQSVKSSGDGQTKKLKSYLNDPAVLADIAEQKRKTFVNKGYEGSITAFLMPIVQPGDSLMIDDLKYPERTGKYFCTGLTGTMNESGGRQKISIGNSL